MSKKLLIATAALLITLGTVYGCSSTGVPRSARSGLNESGGPSDAFVNATAFSPSGKYAARADGKSINIFDPLTSERIRRLTFREPMNALSLAFSPEDLYLAIGTLRNIYVWDMERKKISVITDAHKDGIIKLAFSNDGRLLASASKGSDREIRLWKTVGWKHLRSFDTAGTYRYANNVQAMLFSPDNRLFAAAGLDKKIKIWSLKTGKMVMAVENAAKVNALAFGGDGRTIAAGDDNGRVRLWSVPDGMNLRTLQADNSPITALSFNDEGSYLASASTVSRILRLWNTSSWDYERETLVSASERSLVFDRPTLAAVAFNSAGAVSLYPLTGKEFAYKPAVKTGGIAPIISIISPLPSTEVETENVKISGMVKGAAKIESVELYVNGRLVPTSTRDLSILPSDERILPFTYRLTLTREGPNEIKVIARDTEGLESSEIIQVTKNSEQGQIWGAVIGVSKYRDSSINDLKYAAKDAEAFYHYLKKDFGIPEKNLFALYDTDATVKNIRNLLGVKLKNKARKKDTVIIFYAGHGAPELDSSVDYEDGLEKYFLPHDTDPKSLYSTAFPMKEVENIIGRIKAERVAFIADTCFSGASELRPGRTLLTSRRTRSLSVGDYFKWASQGKGRVVLTASDANERSIEDDTLKHGLFTYYLLEALKGAADFDHNGLITVDEAYKYTSIKVADASNQEQNPTRKGDVRGQIVLGRYQTVKKEGR